MRKTPPKKFKHGTYGGYNRGCRCKGCVDAKRLWRRYYEARRRKRGLCRDCMRSAEPGNQRCAAHLEKTRIAQKGYHLARKAKKKKRDNGHPSHLTRKSKRP